MKRIFLILGIVLLLVGIPFFALDLAFPKDIFGFRDFLLDNQNVKEVAVKMTGGICNLEYINYPLKKIVEGTRWVIFLLTSGFKEDHQQLPDRTIKSTVKDVPLQICLSVGVRQDGEVKLKEQGKVLHPAPVAAASGFTVSVSPVVPFFQLWHVILALVLVVLGLGIGFGRRLIPA
jgi:hypothetical protein